MNQILKRFPWVTLVYGFGHKNGLNCAGVRCLAILPPSVVIVLSANAADKGPKGLDCGCVRNECISKKNTGIGPFVVGTVESSPFKEGERRTESAMELVGRGAESISVFSRDCEAMWNKPSETRGGGSQKPEIGAAQRDAEEIHLSIWVFMIIVVISFFSVSESAEPA